MKTNKKLMTTGSIASNIILFAIPILLGNLFQQLYTVVDSIVIGNYVNKEALAAVTSVGPLSFLFVGFFVGTFIGAGVVISRYFGANDTEKVQLAIHTSVAFALLCSAVLSVLGILMTPSLLKLMQTPPEVYEGAKDYIQIYFLGISSLIMYNSAAGILRALGDSRHPLYYLIVSSVINIILDLVFVVVFGWGIKGAASATIVGQTISTILSYRILFKSNDEYRVHLNKIKFDKTILKQILIIGIPSGLQSSISAFSNVFLQSGINSFGAVAMAGSGAFSRSQAFLFKPITSFAQSLTTFTSQNLGAGEYDRVKKGVRFGMTAITSLAVVVSLVLYIFAPNIISLFSDNEDVIRVGIQRAHFVAPGLVILAVAHTLISIFRGAGKSFVPMVVMLVFFCIFRILFVMIALRINHDIRLVFVVYPLSWFLGSIVFIIYYFKVDWMHNKLK